MRTLFDDVSDQERCCGELAVVYSTPCGADRNHVFLVSNRIGGRFAVR